MLASVFANVHCLFYSRCMDNCIMCHCALTFSMHVRYVVVTTMLFGFVCFFLPFQSLFGFVCVCVCVVSWRCCCCLRPPSLSLDIVLLSKVVGKEFSSLSFYVKSKFSFLFGFWLRPFLPQSFIRSHSRVVLWHCKRRCEIENKM